MNLINSGGSIIDHKSNIIKYLCFSACKFSWSLKVSDSDMMHYVTFLNIICNVDVIKTTEFLKLVLLPPSGETDWPFVLLTSEDGSRANFRNFVVLITCR